jgi:hypothetical protein
MSNNYQHLTNQRCLITETGEEVVVLGLFYNLPTPRFPEGRIWAHIDGDGIVRGTTVPADQLELA